MFAAFAVTLAAAATVAIALPAVAGTAGHASSVTVRPLALREMQPYAAAAALPQSAVVEMPACSTCH
jgi:Mg/Co/Ni transporter MgtE